MILLLDSSTPVCKLSIVDDDSRKDYEWQSDKMLAHGLLEFIDTKLKENNKDWFDISGIGTFEGPGSFTGIRIGLTVMNTIADSQNIPIVGARGDDWRTKVLKKLDSGENETIVLPFYGGEANITAPKK